MHRPLVDSAIRLVDSEQPVTKINSSDMTCGMPRKGSQARAVATAQPGSQMQVYWMGGPDGKVPVSNVSFSPCAFTETYQRIRFSSGRM